MQVIESELPTPKGGRTSAISIKYPHFRLKVGITIGYPIIPINALYIWMYILSCIHYKFYHFQEYWQIYISADR